MEGAAGEGRIAAASRMSIALAFLARAWPYLLAATLGAAVAYKLQGVRIASLEADSAKYHAQVAEAAAVAQAAYGKALQAQIDARTQTDAHNEQVLATLAKQRDEAIANHAHDADLIQRLLIASHTSRPGGTAVPEAGHQSGTAATSTASGNGSVAQLLGNASDECTANRQQLDALIAQLIPQL